MTGERKKGGSGTRIHPQPRQTVYLLRPVFARDPLLECLEREGLTPQLLPIIQLQPSSELPFDYSNQERTLWFFPGRLSVYVFWSYFWHLFSRAESLVLCRGTGTHSLFAYLLKKWHDQTLDKKATPSRLTSNPQENADIPRYAIHLLEPCPLSTQRKKQGKQPAQILSMDTLSAHIQQHDIQRVVFVLRNGETFPYLQKYGAFIEQYASIEWVLWEAYSVVPHPGWKEPYELEHWLKQAVHMHASGLVTSILPLRYLQPHLMQLQHALRKINWYVVGQTTATYAQMIGFPFRAILPLGTPHDITHALLRHLNQSPRAK